MSDTPHETPREAWLDEAEIVVEPGHHRMKLAEVLRHFRVREESTVTLDVKLEEASEVVGRLAELMRETGEPAETEKKLGEAFHQIGHVQQQLDHLQERLDEIRGQVGAMRRVAFVMHEAPNAGVRYATTETIQSAPLPPGTPRQRLPERQQPTGYRREPYVPPYVPQPPQPQPPQRTRAP